MNELIYDVTLRDGSHANRHSFSKLFCDRYIDEAYKAGLRHIEIGHGNGLGGSSLHIGKLANPDSFELISEKTEKYKDLVVGVHVIPGLATFGDMDDVAGQGARLFRVACHCSEADTCETYIEHARNKGLEAWGLLMMVHMIKPDHLAREAKKLESYGATRIVLLDSAGAMTPKMVKEMSAEVLSVIDVPLGFHGHNNLHAAVANSLAAIESGCTSVDGCTRGYGAGAGNLSIEALVALLEKDGVKTGIDTRRIMRLAIMIEKEFKTSLPEVDSLSTATGFSGVFSGFKSKIKEAAEVYGIDELELIEELGRLQTIAGQEDQIIATAAELLKGEVR